MGLFLREKETAPCTVTISHRFEELSAHVRLDNGAVIHPGDTVQVQGFLKDPQWAIDQSMRILGREWRPDNVCSLELA